MVGNFIEVDFPTVTARKCQLIKKSRVLLDKIVAQDEDGVDVRMNRTDLHGKDYHVVGADFTNVAALEKKLAECNVDYRVVHVVRKLGWVDHDFGFSNFCQVLLGLL